MSDEGPGSAERRAGPFAFGGTGFRSVPIGLTWQWQKPGVLL
jgi:hypothetical protein